MKELKNILRAKGHIAASKENNFYKKNGQFFICIYFQWSGSQNCYFLDLGIHPYFSRHEEKIKEIDCALRTRVELTYKLHPDINLTRNNQEEFESVVDKLEVDYKNVSDVFTSLNPEKELKQDVLLSKFIITEVNLCRLYVEHYNELGNVDLADEFARYGLLIAPKMAVCPRRFFKDYLNNI